MAHLTKRLIVYFARPFPPTKGFSPYRQPGVMVHLPVWAIIVLAGYYWSWGMEVLRPLITLYIVAGLYIGRDLAIWSHYAGCLGLIAAWVPICLLIAFLPLSSPEWLRNNLGNWYLPLSLAVAALVILGQYLSFRYFTSAWTWPEGESS